MSRRTDLDVDDDPAHERAKDPRVRHVPDDGWRRAEHHDQNIGQGQVDDEDVCHRLHGTGRRHGDEDLPTQSSARNGLRRAFTAKILCFLVN